MRWATEAPREAAASSLSALRRAAARSARREAVVAFRRVCSRPSRTFLGQGYGGAPDPRGLAQSYSLRVGIARWLKAKFGHAPTSMGMLS